MKLIIVTGSEWIYTTVILCIIMLISETAQWILSKLFPFEDCNQYTKDRIGARAAILNMRKLETEMRSTLYNGY